jgi:peroxiredoxin
MMTVEGEAVSEKLPFLILVALLVPGCSEEPDYSQPNPRFVSSQPVDPGDDPYGLYNATEIRFIDNASSNVDLSDAILSSRFLGLDNAEHTPSELAADAHLVLIVLRGYTDPICPACTRQTAQLISNYPEFVSRGAQVAVVYPIENSDQRAAWEDLLHSARTQLENSEQEVPFTLLFDVGLSAITELGLKDQLSKPATYIISRDGEVVFAYEGKGGIDAISDRPSIESILVQLDELGGSETSESPPAQADAET